MDTVLPTLNWSIDPDGIATVLLDFPEKSVNTITPQVLGDLDAVLESFARELPKGIIVSSAKPRSFVAGADLFELRKMTDEQLDAFLAHGQRVFDRIEKLPVTTIAAINADALGGGFELALACDYRVAADVGSINIGLPEVKLGILPGWGGTVRLPRLIGVENALPLLLVGKTLPPGKALKAGLVDAVAPPADLLTAARQLVLQRGKRTAPSLEASDARKLDDVLDRSRQRTMQSTGTNYPAPLRLIDVLRTGREQGPAAGSDAERKALIDLRATPTAQNLMRLFFLRQGAKKAIFEQIHAKAAEVKKAAVFGGGTMGVGIVHALLRAGIAVRLIEVNDAALSSATLRVQKLLNEDLAGGRIQASDAQQAIERLLPATQWTGLESADIVIEAVIENLEAKQELFKKLDAVVNADCVLATNTSSLSVTQIAAVTAHPARVVGLHFFNPVPRMPLVEVVRAAHSDEQSLATAAGLAIKLGKTPVLVNDAPGFIVNRVLIPYVAAAVELASAGASIIAIDNAMKQWGMPMGPFELLDEIGLDISDHILRSLREQLGPRIPTPPVLSQAVARGWLGKKSGRGFYQHGDAPGKKQSLELNPDLAGMLSADPVGSAAGPEVIQRQLLRPMADEAARLLEEHVVESVDAIDLATVLGAGVAPFRGGLARWMRSEEHG